jgi:hypothetical protein
MTYRSVVIVFNFNEKLFLDLVCVIHFTLDL